MELDEERRAAVYRRLVGTVGRDAVEVLVKGVVDAPDWSRLATKDDLVAVQAELVAEFGARLESVLDRIDRTNQRLDETNQVLAQRLDATNERLDGLVHGRLEMRIATVAVIVAALSVVASTVLSVVG